MNHESHFRIRTVQNKYKKNHIGSLISSRKFRVALSVVGVYTIVGAGIGWFLMTPNSDLASADKLQNDTSLIVRLSEEKSEGENVSLKLTMNNTNKNIEIVDVISDFYTSENNINWQSMTPIVADNLSSTQNSFANQSYINLNPLSAGESMQYLVKGKIKNKAAKNITVMTHIKYSKNDNPFEISSNKVFFSFE
jgi:hypothetical protein